MNNIKIPVVKPQLPPKDEYTKLIDKIWERNILTNQGPYLRELEDKIKQSQQLKYFQMVTNGTIAIQFALRALDLPQNSEIITTPFSYVATLTSIIWENFKPVFVDISPDDFNIDASQIESKITENTRAILAVHVFGNPCDVYALNKIAEKYNLNIIYDAAHAFGCKLDGKSLLEYGDISTVSFHATKVFHTVEGGGVVTSNKELFRKIDLLKKFGHEGDTHLCPGINGKCSEIHAAMGLALLPHLPEIISKRKQKTLLYDSLLKDKFVRPKWKFSTFEPNYAYYPIVLSSEQECLKTKERLEKSGIGARRYFYPSLNTLPYITRAEEFEISQRISKRILCLPLYPELRDDDIKYISELILQK